MKNIQTKTKKTQIRQLNNEIRFLKNKFKISLRDMSDDEKIKSLEKMKDLLNSL